MQYEKSCGAIVYRKYHGNTEILLIRHINSGHWSFPKGHMEEGETEIQTAKREVLEETSVRIFIDPTFHESVHYSPRPGVNKEVVYFVARADNTKFSPQKEEVSDIKWVELENAVRVLTYENDKSIVAKATPLIKQDAKTI